ncbi:MAG TPA: DUF6475 domain-containing protein [Gammaproteobacteria bacterium]|nr:DUF6475 domain-containing protein [Gammaproteobacteria bacterium]
MEVDDVPKFTIMMVGIGEIYRITISKFLTDIYWQSLKQFEWQDVERAFNAHIHNPDCGQFFPKPADVVRFIEGSGETRALQAWSKVEQAIVQVGIYQSVVFDDPLIHAVLENMGGWIKLCNVTFDELPFRANEFNKRYMGFVHKKPERHPKYLAGITECENAKNDFPIPAPLLLGDLKKAAVVMQSGNGSARLLQHSSDIINSVVNQLCISENANV